MLLNEVALGKMKELYNDMYMEKPQPGSHSTKALGATAPDPKETQNWYAEKTKKTKTQNTKQKQTCFK